MLVREVIVSFNEMYLYTHTQRRRQLSSQQVNNSLVDNFSGGRAVRASASDTIDRWLETRLVRHHHHHNHVSDLRLKLGVMTLKSSPLSAFLMNPSGARVP